MGVDLDDLDAMDAADDDAHANGARHAPIDFATPAPDAIGQRHGASDDTDTERPPSPAPRLGDRLEASILRAERRCEGREKPVALPWPILADHFGGGFWPGLHFLNAGTGVGKTQLGFQVALHAATLGVPVLYIGLELGELDVALRSLGLAADVPWSQLWTGRAGPAHLARVRDAVPALRGLPFHYEIARPMGFSAGAIRIAIEQVRALYPEPEGPGSRPLLVVVDFLQLVGDDPGDERELRVRIGRAAYALRDAANRLDVAVLCISSVARERLKMLSDIVAAAGLTWEEDGNGCPIHRRILDPDAIVGTGKESGEIEYSADSVSILARVPGTWDGTGYDVVFATAKGRATGAMWSPLRFTGFRYQECSDRGGRMVEAWKAAAEKRATAASVKKQKKEDDRAAKITRDAAAVASYVLAHALCPVREARVNAVKDSARRWTPAVAKLGPALQEGSAGKAKLLSVIRDRLPADVLALVIVDGTVDHVHSPPTPPPPSTSTVDGQGPTVVRDHGGPSTLPTVSTEGGGP